MKKSISFLFATALCSITLLPSCSNEPKTTETVEQTNIVEQSTPTDTQSNAQAPEEYVSPLPDDAPIYKVGISAGYAPFEFKDEFGKVIGYDIDIVRAIGEEAGFKVEFYDIPFKDLQPSLANGEYDFGMSSSFKEDDKFISSHPYVRSNLVFLVKKDSDFKTLEDLENQKVAVQAFTSLEETLNGIESINVIPKKSIFLAVQSVFTNEASSAFGEEPILIHQAEAFPENPIDFIYADEPERLRMVVSAVDNKSEVISKVNQGIDAIKANGRYHKINEKWFGQYATKLEIQ